MLPDFADNIRDSDAMIDFDRDDGRTETKECEFEYS